MRVAFRHRRLNAAAQPPGPRARRALASAAALALSGLALAAAPTASAQDCAAPSCGGDISAECLARLAFGAVEQSDACAAEAEAYLSCMRDVAQSCAAPEVLSRIGPVFDEQRHIKRSEPEMAFAGRGMAVYFRDTPESRADAEALRAFMEENGATIEYYDPIVAVCDLDGVDVTTTNVATKLGNPTPDIRQKVVEFLATEQGRTVNFHEWDSTHLDVFVSFCGDPMPAADVVEEPAAPEEEAVDNSGLPFSGLTMAVYFRDTPESRADAAALRAFMETNGAEIQWYDPIAAVCDLDGVDLGKTNVATNPGNPKPDARRRVVEFLEAEQSRQINFHEWESTVLDVFVSFCGDPEKPSE